MAENGARGEVRIEVGDHEILLVPSFENLKRTEAILGRSLVQVSNELAAGMGLTVVETVAAIRELMKSPKMGKDRLAELVIKHGVSSFAHAIGKVCAAVILGSEVLDSDDEIELPEGKVEGEGSAG